MQNIGFIGGGNMASSLIGGLLANGFDRNQICAADPLADARNRLRQDCGIEVSASNEQAIEHAEVAVIAVKPNWVETVLSELQPLLQSRSPLLISVAAGTQIRDIDAWSGGGLPIVRAMPNTPALIRKGISGLYANEQVTMEHKHHTETILQAVGKVVWLSQEHDLNAVTAVSGSGPAYFFYLIEAIEQAATELGLAADTAHQLATETAVGAALLAAQSSESASVLRQRVTSPGGTTEAAIRQLDSAAAKQQIIDAVRAASDRSVAMSNPADSSHPS